MFAALGLTSRYPELTAQDVGVPEQESKHKDAIGDRGVYDYIIVGGGTAGCVLASRLSEDPNVKVLLVERGFLNDTWASRVPLISSDFMSANAPVYKWKTVPQKHANNQEMEVVAGKSLGGTSRLNSLLYTRGAPAEWNGWSLAGRQGWSYNDMLPYFLKSQHASSELVGEHHGHDGEWLVRALPPGWIWSFWPRVIEAAETFGFQPIADVNSPTEPIIGCARIPRTLDDAGRRHAVSSAFLPIKLAKERRARLKICTGTITTKIFFETATEGGKPRAVGVYLQSDKGKDQSVYYARAKREIIVSSGTFGSPHLLLLSGIGPKDQLQEHGIETVKDLPGVGNHLMDHIGVPLSWKAPLKDSLHALQASVWTVVVEIFKYLFLGSGYFLLPIAQIVIFARSALLSPTSHLTLSPAPATQESTPTSVSVVPPELDSANPANIPDIELIPVPLNLNPKTFLSTREGVLSFLSIIVQPKSTGTVRLLSANVRDRPVVDLGVLSAPEDVVVLRKALKLAFTLTKKMREQGYGPLEPFWLPKSEEDDVLDDWIRTHAATEYHYTSSCRMAPEAELGVVDDELKVHGVDSLRIADASIFPSILATHTQAPTVAVSEKCADMICRTYASAGAKKD